jgi:hypothetical protein
LHNRLHIFFKTIRHRVFSLKIYNHPTSSGMQPPLFDSNISKFVF